MSATYDLVPHLTHRAEIYSFPNPWQSMNFGIDGEPRRSGAGVEWIAADRRVLDAEARKLLQGFVDDKTFRVVFDEDDYVVLRRRSPEPARRARQATASISPRLPSLRR